MYTYACIYIYIYTCVYIYIVYIYIYIHPIIYFIYIYTYIYIFQIYRCISYIGNKIIIPHISIDTCHELPRFPCLPRCSVSGSRHAAMLWLTRCAALPARRCFSSPPKSQLEKSYGNSYGYSHPQTHRIHVWYIC